MNLRDKLVASTELAAPDVISIRTVMKRAGGASELRSLPYSDALSRMKKAGREIQAERRTNHRHKPAPKIDQGGMTAWCKKNAKGTASTNKPAKPNKPALPKGKIKAALTIVAATHLVPKQD